MEEKSKVPAIDKADKIFNYLYYKYSATQSSISKDLNLPKATVNRLLEVLTNLKYLNYQDKEYTLGEKFYFFSNRYEKYTLIKNITHPYLEELSLKFKETFKLSVLDNDKIRSIATVESSDLIKVSVAENAIFPLHAGAASKLLICQLSESKLNKLLTKTLSKYTDNTITDREKLKEELPSRSRYVRSAPRPHPSGRNPRTSTRRRHICNLSIDICFTKCVTSSSFPIEGPIVK